MKRSQKYVKISLTLLLFALLSAAPLCTGVWAATGTLYEKESNNTASLADETYDGYNNYGRISSTSDVDWWQIYFNQEGMANFWLGEIPSGCDFDLQVYDYTGTNKLAESLKTSNAYELVKIHVRKGETYRIKISSKSGSSSAYYKLRIKRYDLRSAKMFTFDYPGTNSRPAATGALPYLWEMGYDAGEYENNDAATIYNTLPKTDIFTIVNHAGPGVIQINPSAEYQDLYAKSNADMAANDRALSNYANGALDDVKLIIFAGCETGVTDSSYGNLVDMAVDKGAFCCIGFKNKIPVGDTHEWVARFYEFCAQGRNLGNAMTETNKWAEKNGLSDIIRKQYYGESRLWATVIG